MAGSMWRMNGLWKGMAGALLLCALLLCNEVRCDDDATDATDAPAADDAAVDDAAAAPADADGTPAPDAAAPDGAAAPTDAAAADQSAASGAPGDTTLPISLDGLNPDGTSGTNPPPGAAGGDGDQAVEVKADTRIVKAVVPEVKCVGKEDIQESNAVKAVLTTDNCDTTKRIIQENPAGWCQGENCNLEIFQEGNNVLMASGDAALGTLADALQSEQLKDKLGVTKTETPSSSGSSVFVGILVTGLIAAIAITAAYFKCQRKGDAKGVKLAEEGYPVDQENQGNTLVSVAPLNPPPETQEKPSVNGESPEGAKTQPPPPTNGHSTAKTADTEL